MIIDDNNIVDEGIIGEEINSTVEMVPDDNPKVNEGMLSLQGMFESWFIDYASYVILDRAVPEVLDGLKPVQRRILHAMKELDDGRYNKVANIIGHSMKYHPHGDSSIGGALVQLGQKDLLIDCQGNWGNILTGDSAAAPRYIEARLSKFALEVAFNSKTTEWKLSYDGRNKEPIALPVKFPLLLAQGVEGIAVGLNTKVLPHNFNELIETSIAILRKQDFEIYPDFQTGGMIDVSKYNEGKRGGKVRIRAKIKIIDKKTIAITEIPFFTTTSSVIDSIIAQNDKGKIKIKSVVDNTSDQVEIVINLIPGISPDLTIDALYAFTDCEKSISPNACVIRGNRPAFLGVKELLITSTWNTVRLLELELNIRLNELHDQWHYSSLERIFIENRIYHDIEVAESQEEMIEIIDLRLTPFKPQLMREVTEDDILRLVEIRIKRITKFDVKKAEEFISGLEDEMEEVRNHIAHIIDYSINYFKALKKKYGEGRERKTEIKSFDNIEAVRVAIANEKLYVNREQGFAGYGMKKDEYVCDCSDIDDIIAIRADGTFIVSKVADKAFMGNNIIHIDVFRKNDDRTIYNLAYQDGKIGGTFVKRFAIGGITRDKEYSLTQGKEGSKVLYCSVNPNGEAEVVKVILRPKLKLKKLTFEFDFASIEIKGRAAKGNTLTKHLVKSITKKNDGISTLNAREIWYDENVQRLNTDGRGKLLGAFAGNDKILSITKTGCYKLYGFDLSTHFDDDMVFITKFNDKNVITSIYVDGETSTTFVKRFNPESTDKKVSIIGEHVDSKQLFYSLDYLPMIRIVFDDKKNGKTLPSLDVNISEFIEVKGVKAKGKRLTNQFIKNIIELEPLPFVEEELIEQEEDDVVVDDKSDPEVVEEIVAVPKSGLKFSFEENPEEKKKIDDNAIQMTLF